MATINFTQAVLGEYNVTLEQIDRATRILDGRRNKVFYQVESQTDPTIDPYHVEFNDEHKVLTCTCKAAAAGFTCWHRRAALAAERIFRYEQAQGYRREAQAVERTADSRYEKALFDLEQAQQEVAAAKRERDAVHKYGLDAYQPTAFSLMR